MRIFPGCTCIWIISLLCNAETKWIPNFFVPEEITTILQLVYSRLPPTKIGSDHRFGVGFRVGKNADAQILVELGPQSETQPLMDPGNGVSKRESRPKPPSESKGRNLNSIDTRVNLINKMSNRRNHTKTATEKKDITKAIKNKNDSNVKRTQEPLESFGNILMRWFRWLVQPRQDRIKSVTQERRSENNNEIPKIGKVVEGYSKIPVQTMNTTQIVT